MNFKKLSLTFQKLSQTSKRLEKILIIRDELNENKKEIGIIFDIISGNFQRELSKKTIGISVRTILDTISFVSKVEIKKLEKELTKYGDIGKIAQENINSNKQKSIIELNPLTIEDIIKALNTISNKTGTNSNKRKKEILSKLFLRAEDKIEYKFLARLLINDLRIGVSEGVLKDSLIQIYFPKILGINWYCKHCNYLNITNKTCFKCSKKKENENKYIPENIKTFNLDAEKNTSLSQFNIQRNQKETLAYILRNFKENDILIVENPTQIYKEFQKIIEQNYNLLNSFKVLIKEIEKDKNSLLKPEIKIGMPVKSMLGTRAKNIQEAFKEVGKPALFDFKYDGLRMQIHNNKGNVKLFTRNLEEISEKFPEIVKYFQTNFSDISFIIDSECVGYDYKENTFLPFQTLSKRILTKDTKQVDNIKVILKAFDILYLNGETLIEKEYIKRREILEDLLLNRELVEEKNIDIDKIKERLINSK